PGCSTMAWPPSWNAPSSKLVRVRMDGLKNTSAIVRPLSSLPSLLRLNAAASASNASRSGRLQSWVLRKCLSDIDRSLAVVAGTAGMGDAWPWMTQSLAGETFAAPETKKPSLGLGSPTDSTTLRLPSEKVGFRPARARRHPGGHPGGASGVRLKVGIHGPGMVACGRTRRKYARAGSA